MKYINFVQSIQLRLIDKQVAYFKLQKLTKQFFKVLAYKLLYKLVIIVIQNLRAI